MKKLVRVILAFTFGILVNTSIAQDLELWYHRPAEKWVEALPIGNGRIGAMIFGGIDEDRIQFNEETLWTGSVRNYNRQNAWRYLDSIRNLLFAGKQREAEELAEREFMGIKSAEGDKEAWIEHVTAVLKQNANPSQYNYNDASWKTIKVPSYEGWEVQGFEGMDGAVWFRYYFQLPKEWEGKNLILDLNRVSEYDFTYINGALVGSQYNTQARRYEIPASLLKKGKNSIAILVLNFSGKGGILGYKDTTQHIGLYPKGSIVSEKLSLNGEWKYYIQDDDPPPVGQYQASYQPFGDLNLDFDINIAAVSNYKRSLDLSNAIATTQYDYNGVHYKREYFASAPSQTLVVHLSANKNAAISFAAGLSSPHKKYSLQKINANTVALTVSVKHGALYGVSYLMVQTDGGRIDVCNEKVVISNANTATLYLTAATNFVSYNDVSGQPDSICRSIIDKVQQSTFSDIRKAHIAEYQQYFNTFFIALGNEAQRLRQQQKPTDLRLAAFVHNDDPSFLALYVQYGRYLLISSSRPRTRPANLQGIWNDLLSPPWGSKYTTNINLEMNYWPADLLNLSPMQQPLFEMIKELAVTGTETAKQYYNAPGWVLHHNTDLWRGTAPINAANHGIWVGGAAWLCDHLWQHYLYTLDKKFLEQTAYPIMKSAAQFFNAFLIKDPKTGYLISAPSNSPEHGGLVAGPTMDHQLIRNLFQSVIKASEILKKDDEFRDTLKNKVDSIFPNKIGRYGQLQEWMEDVDDTTNKHRHLSHLWAVYPGSEINWEQTPELMKAARQSLVYRGDEATGWSLAWKINLWARFKDAERAYKLIQMLLSPVKGGAGSYPNLFDAHPPFQIDGNFGGAAGLGEMLLQSHAGFLEVLPALPAALSNGWVKGLLARGGFEVEINWKSGQLQYVIVHSKAGMPLKLRYQGKEVAVNTVKGGVYKFSAALQQL